MQLELFQGAHVPLARCLAALQEADVRAAREALADAEPDGTAAADRARLALIEARVPPLSAGRTISPREVHATFEAALERHDPDVAGSAIPAATWFHLYARHMATALEADPGRRFRGWCALHFQLAAGRPEDAVRNGQQLLSCCDQAWAVIECARAAWAAGEGARAERWVVLACLKDDMGLDPNPPRIASAVRPALNPPPGALPRFPRAIEDLWGGVEGLELPGPVSAWVPAVGIIDGVFSPSLLGWSMDFQGSGFDPAAPAETREPAARAFLRALIAARQARTTMPVAAHAAYGEAELAARRQMQRIAPALLARYLARLR